MPTSIEQLRRFAVARSLFAPTTLKRAVRERGAVQPREVDLHFAHGRAVNAWGGSSNATTHLLDGMHYRGLLGVARPDGGIRLYAAHDHDTSAIDAGSGRGRLRHAPPQWHRELKAAALRAKQRLAHERVDGTDWYWPAAERLAASSPDDSVRLLAPFDPVVWDRRRFELFWGWAFRFEAYTPATKRKLGYYALPMLWRDQVIGWGKLAVKDGALVANFGYIAGRAPRDAAFRAGLRDELERLRLFLGAER